MSQVVDKLIITDFAPSFFSLRTALVVTSKPVPKVSPIIFVPLKVVVFEADVHDALEEEHLFRS